MSRSRKLLVLHQDLLLQLAQLGARLDAELVTQQTAAFAVDLERLRLPAASVESDHQLSAEVLAPSRESDLILDALLARFLLTISNSSGVAVEPSAIVRRFERLLEQRFREQHDVAAYASALGLTADHVSSAVRAHHGVSAKALIDRRVFVDRYRAQGDQDVRTRHHRRRLHVQPQLDELHEQPELVAPVHDPEHRAVHTGTARVAEWLFCWPAFKRPRRNSRFGTG